MNNNIKLSINIPNDKDGMIGRECLKCKKYFKVKFGTGLTTSYCHCPYCDYEGESNTFWTTAQIEYAKSVAFNKIIGQIMKPALRELENSFKELEKVTKNSLIQYKVKTTGKNYTIPIKHYSERDLETTLTCNNCGLVFSIYGVFARCPDCIELNAFLIYEKSLEATKKQFDVIIKSDSSKEIKENLFVYVLSSCISAFDGLGKELRKRKPALYSVKSKNLFQNLFSLNKYLENYIKNKHTDFDFLIKMFQVRHIYEHNMGVIDKDFVTRLPEFCHYIDRKYILNKDELDVFLTKMVELGNIIKEHFYS